MNPLLNPDEMDCIQDYLKENKTDTTKMVEWGSGGSTLMLIPYFESGTFISIEHNDEWFDKVSKELGQGDFSDEALENFTYCHLPPNRFGKNVDLDFYRYANPFEENPCFARSYINPETDQFKVFDADIFFVDGICRGAILATIFAKARNRNAAVFIHDYYGPEGRTDWYNWASSLYARTERVGVTMARLYL